MSELDITADPYDEDGYCEWCGNGRWKHHGYTCEWADFHDPEIPTTPIRSMAASARYSVRCDQCGADAHEPCRTELTGRVTDAHLARRKRNWRERDGEQTPDPAAQSESAPTPESKDAADE